MCPHATAAVGIIEGVELRCSQSGSFEKPPASCKIWRMPPAWLACHLSLQAPPLLVGSTNPVRGRKNSAQAGWGRLEVASSKEGAQSEAELLCGCSGDMPAGSGWAVLTGAESTASQVVHVLIVSCASEKFQ